MKIYGLRKFKRKVKVFLHTLYTLHTHTHTPLYYLFTKKKAPVFILKLNTINTNKSIPCF